MKARGYDGDVQVTDLSNPEFQTTIVCSSSIEKILDACVARVAAGDQVVELCGGFTEAEARLVQESVGENAAVGHVKFDEAGAARLQNLGFRS
jgi:tRNA G37 N-methylase TrmD